MSTTVYKKTALTGGTATDLDGINGTGLVDSDMAFVTVAGVLYTYILDDDSGAAESSPNIIAPDTNPGNKRWVLKNVSGISAPLTNLLSNSGFSIWSNGTAENVRALPDATSTRSGTTVSSDAHLLTAGMLVKAADGTILKVITVDTNSFTVDRAAGTDGQWYEAIPGCVAADPLAADGHSKTSTLDARRFYNTDDAYGYGQYLLELTKGADSAEYYNLLDVAMSAKDLHGQSVAFGCWAYSVTKSSNVKGSIIDSNGEIAVSSTFAPAGAKTWIEITGTVSATATSVYPRILCDEATGDVCYISEPMMVKGSSVGSGNYQPKPNEWIWLERADTTILSSYNNSSGNASAVINLQSESNGKIGAGVKAVKAMLIAQNTAAGKLMQLNESSAQAMHPLPFVSQVANVSNRISGEVRCNADGNLYAYFQDANFSSVYVIIGAVQL